MEKVPIVTPEAIMLPMNVFALNKDVMTARSLAYASSPISAEASHMTNSTPL